VTCRCSNRLGRGADQPNILDCDYVNRALLPSVRPVAVGWKSTKHPLDFDHPSLDLREDAAKLEEGTPNSMGIYGLEAALELLLEAGIARIAGHVTEWLAALEKELRVRGCDPRPAASHRAGILSFAPPQEAAAAFVARAQAAGVVLSLRRGRVRVSAHLYNGERELDALCGLLRGP